MCKKFRTFANEIDYILDIVSRFASIFALFMTVGLLSCKQGRERIVTPYGSVLDSVTVTEDFDLAAIQTSGDLIMATINGPQTFYDYHGKSLGTQYLLCQRFADSLGCRLRVDICRDSLELVKKQQEGETDLIAFATPGHIETGMDKPQLAEEFSRWFCPELITIVRDEENDLFTTRKVRRRIFSPMLDAKGGIISHYDQLFITYSRDIRWDWRLMAAQCYQESTFDPRAVSFAGAKGLMQIMPGTADHLGLPRDRLYDPESNIRAAAQYIAKLQQVFSDIGDPYERTNFVLASYNGGSHHIRDAMALASRDGRNPHRWADVSIYVLRLAQPQYYNDPIVRHGYMRGSETVDYVSKIRQRYATYQGVKSPQTGFHSSQPRKADKRKNKYDL